MYGLSEEETKDLWVQADIDGNGVLDHKEFQERIWNPMWSYHVENTIKDQDEILNGTQLSLGLGVTDAALFPSETENGLWPEDYSLSDHARLTVVFSPIRLIS